jgi:hypothetical protein
MVSTASTSNQVSKRSLDEFDFVSDDCYPSKNHCTSNDNRGGMSLVKAAMMQCKSQAGGPITLDYVASASEQATDEESDEPEEALLEKSFEPTNWHVVSFAV